MNKASLAVIILIILGGIVFAVLRPEKTDETPQDNDAMSRVEVPIYSTGTTRVGTVIFSDEAGKTKVSITMSESSAQPQTASLRAGTCDLAGAVRYQLKDVVSGKSETVLTPAMHFIHGLGDTVISVGTACGNVRQAFDAANHAAQ